MSKNKISVAFIDPPSGALGEPPESEDWMEGIEAEIKQKLEDMYPDIQFDYWRVSESEDVDRFVRTRCESAGFLVFTLNCIAGLVRPILQSGTPTVLINETYGGSGEYLLEYNRARKAGKPVIGTSVRDVADESVLENVKFLDVLGRLKNSKVLYIVSSGVSQIMNYEYPLSVDLWSSLRSIKDIAGIDSETLNAEDFVPGYYERVSDEKVEEIYERWLGKAEKVTEEEVEEIEKSARLYLAAKKAADEHDADAVAIDCIVLYRNDFLDAWPCLGFRQMYEDGDLIPVCEADPFSAFSLLTMDYLAGLPGFINDPSPDDSRNEMVYYHCYAPTNPHGSTEEESDYKIMPAHLGGKRASVCTDLPTGEEITVVGLDPESQKLTLHTAQAVDNEDSSHACATKLVGKTDTKKIAENWRERTGWHRVVFYGNWREDLKKLATLLNLDVLEEDREKSY